jgi:uncharacterized protein (TIGR02217 family)
MTPFFEGEPPLLRAAGYHAGPERRTDIVALASGREHRNAPWAHGRRRFDIGGALTTLDDIHALIAFFEARRGRLQAFRFRDPTDWKSCAPLQEATALDQSLGTWDGATTQFQLVKRYGAGADAYVRSIRKPVPATVLVAVSGAQTTAFAVSATTGLVTFATPPAAGAALTAGFHFHTPVRFDCAHLDLKIETTDAACAPSVPLIEVLV